MQRPHRVFARRADAEVGAGHQDLAIRVFRLVEHEVRIAAPRVEQRVVEAGARHALEEHGGNDLVGVYVRAAQRHARTGECGEFFHR